MPLTMASVGKTYSIARLSGRDEVRRHLSEMGLVVGSPVTIVSDLGGNLILSVGDSRIALDRTMACRIHIEGGILQ